MLPSRLSRGLLAPVAVLAAVSMNLNAAEWVAEPSISLRAEYDDNPRLVTDSAESVWGMIIDPRLKLSRRSELWDIDANGRVRDSRYDGQDGLDSTDTFLNLGLKRRFERGSFRATAAQIDDTTLQDEVLDLDTGLTVFQVDRTRRNYLLAGQYMLTETTWLEGSAAYSTVEYDGGADFGLTDYDTLSPALQLVHQLNSKLQVFGIYSLSTTEYDRDDDLETTTDSLQVGMAYSFTELWRVSGSIGRQNTQTEQTFSAAVPRPGFEMFFPFIFDVATTTTDTETSGTVYNVDLSRRFETGSISLSGSRSVEPSSTGTSADTTSVTLSGDRKFSAKLSGNIAVSYLQSERIGTTTTTVDRDRYRLSPSLTWRLDEELVLNAGYNYTHVSRSSSGNNNADRNAVYIGIGYTWPRMAMSR